jgi:hypothetical protein
LSAKRKVCWTLVALLLARTYVRADVPPKGQAEVNRIVAMLGHNEIVRVDILNVPSRILTRTALTPEMLDAQFSYRLTISDARGDDALLRAAKSISAQPRNEPGDLRWAAIFYGVDGARVGAFYFDTNGSSGAVDSEPVSFSGDFFKWLNDNFSACFR